MNRRHVSTLMLRSSSGRHGPERAIAELIPSLRAFNVTTSVVALYRRPRGGPVEHPWLADLRGLGVAAQQLIDPAPYSIDIVPRIAWRARRSDAEVLHTHDYKTNLLGGVAARRAGAAMPWVATVHLHTVTSARLRIYRALDLFLLRLADRVITVSRDQRRLLLRRGVDRRRIVLMPNVIDADRFASEAAPPAETRRSLGIGEDSLVITQVGRLTRQKGPDVLLAAAQQALCADGRPKDWRFMIVGGGPLAAELEAAALERGISENVAFLGYRTDIASLLAASDIVVVPSRAEGHPVALLEALALARPVVASRVGGIPDVVTHAESAWLMPPERPDCLAEALAALADRPEERRRLGEAGRHVVRRDCSPARAARRLAGVYRTVVAERQSA